MLTALCIGKYPYIGLGPGFQVKSRVQNMYGEWEVEIPARFDDKVTTLPGTVYGDRDDDIKFTLEKRRFLTSKRIVLQVTEFGGTTHDLIFTFEPLNLNCRGGK